jgi:hypothetical protein
MQPGKRHRAAPTTPGRDAYWAARLEVIAPLKESRQKRGSTRDRAAPRQSRPVCGTLHLRAGSTCTILHLRPVGLRLVNLTPEACGMLARAGTYICPAAGVSL